MWQKWLMKRVMDTTSVRFVENYCLYSRNKDAVCTSCIDICPTKALTLKAGKIEFEQNSCNDCNLCIHQCPTDALYLEREMLHQYEKKIVAREEVCFTCEKQAENKEDIIIPCLSSLTPELVLISLLHHSNVQIFYEPSKCKSCSLNNQIDKYVSWLQELDYISCGEVQFINDFYEKKSRKKDLSRRELFSFTKGKTKDEVGTLLMDSFDHRITVKNKLPIPERRKYLAEFIKKEAKEKYLSVPFSKGLQLTKITVKEDCDLCGRCTLLCPTGALSIVEKEDFLSLSYTAIKCINCEFCSNSCSYINRTINTTLCKGLLKPKVIKKETFTQCRKCGDKITVEAYICRDCIDQENKRNETLLNW